MALTKVSNELMEQSIQAQMFQNPTHFTVDFAVDVDKNGLCAGPVTIDNGVTVTVPSGSVWSIV